MGTGGFLMLGHQRIPSLVRLKLHNDYKLRNHPLSALFAPGQFQIAPTLFIYYRF